MRIYRASIDDLDDVALLFDRYRVFYSQSSDLAGARKFIHERLQTQDAVILVAAENEVPVGYTQLFPSWSSVSMKRVWILNDLYVEPEYRNQGIAKALMESGKRTSNFY